MFRNKPKVYTVEDVSSWLERRLNETSSVLLSSDVSNNKPKAGLDGDMTNKQEVVVSDFSAGEKNITEEVSNASSSRREVFLVLERGHDIPWIM